ncbi:uncharacterized protein LY79DRAFT_278607 [Colletotrichum navitas]|uniref:Uncharacterized protein n=1 Tax=Colletotrichum navitas TaxID=681940 RepID=A0AAD8PW68_9PEZI|nr:uncharacterized protein LY79DRAFT_278607 [Colletotrichum navitas]KAK1585089.1 hypothetical protein LY79DRAFT_278607 [Colletotrichum navitas]
MSDAKWEAAATLATLREGEAKKAKKTGQGPWRFLYPSFERVNGVGRGSGWRERCHRQLVWDEWLCAILTCYCHPIPGTRCGACVVDPEIHGNAQSGNVYCRMLFPALQTARAACHRPGVLRREGDLNGLAMASLGGILQRGRGRHSYTGKLVEHTTPKIRAHSRRKPWASRSAVRARLELAWELRQRLGQAEARGLRVGGLVRYGRLAMDMQHLSPPIARVKSDGWVNGSLSVAREHHRNRSRGSPPFRGSETRQFQRLGRRGCGHIRCTFPRSRAAGGYLAARMTSRVALGGHYAGVEGGGGGWMAGWKGIPKHRGDGLADVFASLR